MAFAIKRESMKKHTFEFISKTVKKLRTARKISQEELSHLLGFKNGQFISNIERAKCSIPFCKIPKMAVIFRVEEDVIIKAILSDTESALKTICKENEVNHTQFLAEVSELNVEPISDKFKIPNFNDYI
jgi:transcriptional regulator with XRE-family HTH domain